LIGQKWKRGDTWSGLILIGRGLILYTFLTIESISDLVLKESPILSIPFSADEAIRRLSEAKRLTKRSKKVEDRKCSTEGAYKRT
ncbi:hypothetical protein, partial [Shouchella clausii]|uniref:hypothetical protein n=1 Tax=Shouchella clausii TaxID=79880 RepID=UPI001BB3564D